MSHAMLPAAAPPADDAPTLLDQLIAALDNHRAGRLDSAEASYRSVLTSDPDNPTALRLLGILLHGTDRAAAALPVLRHALRITPSDTNAQIALADVCAATGATADAIALYRPVIAASPGNHAARVNLANLLRDTGDAPGAIMQCRLALATAPRLVPAHITLGSALLAAGKVIEAIGAYRTAVTLDKTAPAALIGLAMALLRDRRGIDALDAASRATQYATGAQLAEACFVQGVAESALRRSDAAAVSLRRAIAANPGHACAHLALGNALADLDRLDESEAAIRTAIACDPSLPEAHASLGFVLTAGGQPSDAIAACTAAIRLRPEFARAHWNRAVAHLLAGDYKQGWADYEWRRHDPQFANDFPALPGTAWNGTDLCGQRILIFAEQGLGDAIQFARYLPELAARGAHVTLACAKSLIPLLATVAGVAAAVPQDGPLPQCDVWAFQMSLPRLLNSTLATLPTPAGYLAADPTRIAQWQKSPPATQPRIGLVWAGNPAHGNDSRRSIPTTLLAPLATLPGIDWVNLQTGGRGPELAIMYRLPAPSSRLTDFAETAALIATLDLVITVDTAVAHLAGALGKPVWIMLPHAPDWRWMLDRDDSPWYATARLFRQDRPGDWPGVLTRVANALDKLQTE